MNYASKKRSVPPGKYVYFERKRSKRSHPKSDKEKEIDLKVARIERLQENIHYANQRLANNQRIECIDLTSEDIDEYERVINGIEDDEDVDEDEEVLETDLVFTANYRYLTQVDFHHYFTFARDTKAKIQ